MWLQQWMDSYGHSKDALSPTLPTQSALQLNNVLSYFNHWELLNIPLGLEKKLFLVTSSLSKINIW